MIPFLKLFFNYFENNSQLHDFQYFIYLNIFQQFCLKIAFLEEKHSIKEIINSHEIIMYNKLIPILFIENLPGQFQPYTGKNARYNTKKTGGCRFWRTGCGKVVI